MIPYLAAALVATGLAVVALAALWPKPSADPVTPEGFDFDEDDQP